MDLNFNDCGRGDMAQKKTEEEEEKKFNLQKIFWRTFPLYLYSYFLKYADGIGKKFIFFSISP